LGNLKYIGRFKADKDSVECILKTVFTQSGSFETSGKIMTEKRIYDLAIVIDWEYDWDFVRLLEEAARKIKLTTYVIWPDNLKETYQKLLDGSLAFRYLFDRASDTSPEFHKIQTAIQSKGGQVLETLKSLEWASDKATMHLEFIARGLNTPYTIILPPYETQKNVYLSVEDLSKLGRTFIIKPANTTGGGIGVVHGAETLQDVLQARQNHRTDKYLLQKKVMPKEKDGYRFWFRGYYSCGLVQCAWWNDLIHKYRQLTREEIRNFRLRPLYKIVSKIAEVSKLHFFSSEIALDDAGKFIVVDYVNESCDMRLQSRAVDGVPDELVMKSATQIVRYIKKQLKVL